MLLEKLRLLECSLHGDRRNDWEWLELILHPAFREITRSGVMVNRSETITALLSEKDEPFILSSDFRLTEMGCGSALLHYRTFALMAAILHYVPLTGFVQMKTSGCCFFTRERQRQAQRFTGELHTQG